MGVNCMLSGAAYDFLFYLTQFERRKILIICTDEILSFTV